jgi:hypothetical protein
MMTVKSFRARYVDMRLEGSFARAVGIWCELNGRLRHFTAENVKELQSAGHHFYVDDVEHEACGIRVVGPFSAAYLRADAAGGGGNLLADLPGRSADGPGRPRDHLA